MKIKLNNLGGIVLLLSLIVGILINDGSFVNNLLMPFGMSVGFSLVVLGWNQDYKISKINLVVLCVSLSLFLGIRLFSYEIGSRYIAQMITIVYMIYLVIHTSILYFTRKPVEQ
ncbi:hypothetical protein K4L44_05005 [Halosquirtibacter laminarini]|uniref:Uncharacterized protein n=1 Tax=Halosquirtibacter laminarini TaxID=3374600 RepID=A0AC61NKK2_9BACT|nr:hypothetical protein K4L44_05005 [Prolixibacteraceae bacterium]